MYGISCKSSDFLQIIQVILACIRALCCQKKLQLKNTQFSYIKELFIKPPIYKKEKKVEWKESRTKSTPHSHSNKQDITAECWGSSTELSVGNAAATATFQPNSIPFNAFLGSTQNNCRDKGQKDQAAQQLHTKHQDYLEGN